nr:sigma-70 family RNA polymerase sigma factor [Polyangium spumosum]
MRFFKKSSSPTNFGGVTRNSARTPLAQAQADLYKSTVRLLRRRLRRLGVSPEDAREIVQHAFEIALPRWHEVQDASEGRRRAWIERITWHLGQNFLRLARHEYEELGHRGLARARAPGSDLDERANAARLVDAALSIMLDEERALFVAYFLEDMTLDELAQHYGVSRGKLFHRLAALARAARIRIGSPPR